MNIKAFDFGKHEKNVVVVSEETRLTDEFKPPTKYFIINAFGEAVHFKTRDRSKAQQWADEIYGKGHYVVREAIKAITR